MATSKSQTPPVPGLERWARFAYRRRGFVILTWFILLIGLSVLSAKFGGEFTTDFELPGSETQKATDLLKDRFPARSGDTADIVFEARDGVATPAVQERMENLFADVVTIPGVVGVESPYKNPGLVGSDGKIARANVQWSEVATSVDRAAAKQFIKVVEAANGDGLIVEAGGAVVQQAEGMEFGSEVIGLGAAIIILLIAFGSVIAAGLPVGAAIFGLGTGFAVIGLAAAKVPFPEFAPQFAGMIGIGVGIDYSLLVLTRFREGLHKGRTVEEAVVLATTTAGRSVIFAGIVVAIAFLGLFAMGIPFIAAMGVTGAIVVILAVLVAVTLMPAMLSLAGTRVDALRIPFLHSTEGVDPKSGWYKWSERIQRRPLPYFLGAAAFLLILASPVLKMELGFTDAGNLPERFHTRKAYDLLTKGFGPGYNGPFILVADVSNGGVAAIDTVIAAVRETPGIAFVGDAFFNEAGDTAVITVIPTTSPQDSLTTGKVHELRDKVIPSVTRGTGAEILLTGQTAGGIDVGDQIRERMPLLFIGVIGLSFILLTVVFRSIFVAAKAAIMNLLSIGASYGVIVAIFQWGWFGDIVGVEKGPIEVFLPMMFFAILFGLSMDYEVFLISRVWAYSSRTRLMRKTS